MLPAHICSLPASTFGSPVPLFKPIPGSGDLAFQLHHLGHLDSTSQLILWPCKSIFYRFMQSGLVSSRKQLPEPTLGSTGGPRGLIR